MMAIFDRICVNVGLQLNLTKTMFMRNGQVSDTPFWLNGMNISKCSSSECLGREVNMANELAPKLSRRKRAAWRAFKSVEEVVKKTKDVRLRPHLFDSAVLPALTYASGTWDIRNQNENEISVAQRGIGEDDGDTTASNTKFLLWVSRPGQPSLPSSAVGELVPDL
ncbi:unnamed protein product [Heligmosomoides polygyrus]|uniref:Reverse transcriptase domain-containing protein n=1 Tax=Heligmosomoides polygyrus TaxID=6339 RepID=A0A183GGE8_HELPZ|nr:unnamed protein product [Heligmosomoides polygyrus]